jgi:hypothetical protein
LEKQTMLAQRYLPNRISALLVPQTEWQPYPTIAERASWEALPASVRSAQVARGEDALGYEWPALPATLFLEYPRIGNRRNYEIPHFQRRAALGNLVLAECVEGQGRFLDEIVNGVWAICEESFWGVPAHCYMQGAGHTLPDTGEPIVDLFAAETAALLAWTNYLLGERLDSVSPVIRPRIGREIDLRMLTPCQERNDFWWMGFVPRPDGRRVNNWNPWIVSNWLACTLLSERDEKRRQRSVFKAIQALDNFIDPYPADGGCDEGPSYWGHAGASLFDCLELLYSASNGEIDVYSEPLIQEIGRFLYRVHIADDYYINFADAPALVYPDAMLVYRYGLRIGDEQMMAQGAWLAERQGVQSGDPEASAEGKTSRARRREVPTSLGRKLPALFSLPLLPGEEAAPPLPRDVVLPQIEVIVARDRQGSATGLLVAAKGGHNDESHNHNDIGNFVIYTDGKPVIVDAGVETYTAKTFGPQRYEIWTMQSAYHTLLPTINGVQQGSGPDFKTDSLHYEMSAHSAQFVVELATAYPPEAGLQSWRRTITLLRGVAVEIVDEYALATAADEISFSLLTPCTVRLEPGMIHFDERLILGERSSGAGTLHFDAQRFQVDEEMIRIEDERLGSTWGEALTRVIFTTVEPPQHGRWVWRFVPHREDESGSKSD